MNLRTSASASRAAEVEARRGEMNKKILVSIRFIKKTKLRDDD